MLADRACPVPLPRPSLITIWAERSRELAGKWLVNSLRAPHVCRTTLWAWPRIPSGHGSNAARKPSMSQVQSRLTLPAPQSLGFPSLVLADKVCPAPRPGPEPSPAFSAFLFQDPVLQSHQLGNPESCATGPPATSTETVPFGAAEKPWSQRNPRASTEASPNLWHPSVLKHWRQMPGHNLSLNSSLEKLPCAGLHVSVFSGWPRHAPREKGPSASGDRMVHRAAQCSLFS